MYIQCNQFCSHYILSLHMQPYLYGHTNLIIYHHVIKNIFNHLFHHVINYTINHTINHTINYIINQIMN